MALSQGLICTKRVHLGLTEVAFIEGCPQVRGGLCEGCPHVRGGLYEGCPHVRGGGVLTIIGVAFIEGCPHIRGGLYRGVSSQ